MSTGIPLQPPGAFAGGHPGPLRSVATALFVVALPVLLFTTGIRLLFSLPAVYDYSVSHFDAPSQTGIPEPELRRANRELVRYFNDDRALFQLEVTDERGRAAPLFTPEETAHLADVKALLRRVYAVQMGALVYVLVYVVAVYVWAREGRARELAADVLWSAGATYALLGAVGVAALTGFGRFWERVHTVLFDDELWRLDPARHHLIQMFPEEFWFQMVALLVGGTLALMGLLALLALLYRRLTGPQRGWAGVPLPQERPPSPQAAAGGPAPEGIGGTRPEAPVSGGSS